MLTEKRSVRISGLWMLAEWPMQTSTAAGQAQSGLTTVATMPTFCPPS